MDKHFNRGKQFETKRRKRREAHGKRKKAQQVSSGCPTPIKTAYNSAETAITSINRGGNAGKGWGTYECICGWWHVTSIKGRLFREFDETYYRNDAYSPIPYNSQTYHQDKLAWYDKKSNSEDGSSD